MNTLKTALALLVSFFMLVSNEITSYFPGTVPDAKSEAELSGMADLFDSFPLAEEIVVVNTSSITKDERTAIQCLQGLVARTESSIFINYGQDAKTELADLEKSGHKLLYTDENGNNWTLSNLIPRYASHIKDYSYVLYTDSDTHGQINTAFNTASLYGWLAVPSSSENIVTGLGMKKAEDYTDDEIDFVFERNFYEKHKDFFRKDALVHLYSYTSGLRDFAVQQKIFITYVDDEDIIARSFRDKIFSDLEPASIILGWCQYEVKFTESVSSFGHYVIPSDHSFNMSLLNCCDYGEQNLSSNTAAPELDPSKHYIAIVYSDGDNAQWISNGYREFYTWQSYGVDTPITWTFAPMMNEFSPTALKKAKENVGNNCFITGPSGAGYARITKMSAKELEVYSDLTAAAMLNSGMTTMTLLDEPLGTYEKSFTKKLDYFSRYSNINGGIIQIDPERYAGGNGKVYFSNEKPFVSVKLSLWHPSGNENEVTQEWLKEQAEIVNNYPADINSINGYSVINVHPWTVGPDDLKYFVSCLDSNVVVITANELIAAVTENVPHNNASPD